MLRCPWHGYDYCPLTGESPFGDSVATFPSSNATTVSTLAVEPDPPHVTTVSDVIAQTLVNWGVRHVFGMVGHSNLGLADALRRQERRWQPELYRHPPRGRGGLRRLSIRKAHRQAGRVPDDRRSRRDEPADRAVGREGGPLAGDRTDRTGRHAGARPGAFQEVDLHAAYGSVAAFSQTVLPTSRHAELASLAAKNAILRRDVAHLIFPDEVQTLPAGERGVRARRAGSPASRSPRRESRCARRSSC